MQQFRKGDRAYIKSNGVRYLPPSDHYADRGQRPIVEVLADTDPFFSMAHVRMWHRWSFGQTYNELYIPIVALELIEEEPLGFPMESECAEDYPPLTPRPLTIINVGIDDPELIASTVGEILATVNSHVCI